MTVLSCIFTDLIVFPADLDSSPSGSLTQWMLTQGQFTHSLWAGVSSLKCGFGSAPSCSILAWFFHSQCTLQHRFKAKPGSVILQINAYFTWTKELDVLSEACRGQCSMALDHRPWHLPFSAGEKNHCFVSQPEYAIVTTESCPYLLFFEWNHPDLLFTIYWQSLLCWILCGASFCKLHPSCINRGREWKGDGVHKVGNAGLLVFC